MSIERNQVEGTLTLSQTKYIEKVLERFNMGDSKARSVSLGGTLKLTKSQAPTTKVEKEEMAQIPYASAVGSIMYAMICSRPDIAYAVGVVSRFMSNPGTSKMGLQFTKGDSILRGYVDADLSGCDDSGRSTTGYVFTVGKTVVSWMSKLQSCVALSTTEAEYMAAAEACKELVWLKNFMSNIARLYSCSEEEVEKEKAEREKMGCVGRDKQCKCLECRMEDRIDQACV
ncbi:secreted RxLR effector protein 161-like [Rutidosis leptorrhynchoides]|uniref:secreted RxLR effector protein 161-like n=1 Tax=Rutidosis leptorrhynchoides TaxID=125765 RepID=UPI003A99254A